MKRRAKKKAKRRRNRELCEKYPFLIPTNAWTGKVEDGYCYDYTYLDYLPTGWRRRFGDDFAEELGNLLLENNYADKYVVVEVKEKFGQMRWYDNGVPEQIEDEYDNIIDKYTDLSEHTCVKCGSVGHLTSISGWIEPYCKQCYDYIVSRYAMKNIILATYEEAIGKM